MRPFCSIHSFVKKSIWNKRQIIQKHKNTLLGYFFVTLMVLLWTRIDFVVHYDAYIQPNIFIPTEKWLISYWIPYFIQYYVLTAVFLVISKSWKHTIPMAIFFGATGADLIYYLWNGFSFPVAQWTWMPWYKMFGFWTTQAQLTWVFGLTIISVLTISTFRVKHIRQFL